MRGHFDGDRYDINPVIADHREGIGKPAISPEGFSRLPCTLLVARCHGRELEAGKTVEEMASAAGSLHTAIGLQGRLNPAVLVLYSRPISEVVYRQRMLAAASKSGDQRDASA